MQTSRDLKTSLSLRETGRERERHSSRDREEGCVPVFVGADGVAGSVYDGGEHPYRLQIWKIIGGGSCFTLLQRGIDLI